MTSAFAAAVAPPAVEGRSVDPLLWRACAGGSVHVPPVGSLVYYFPQGHAEQASSAADLSSSSVAVKPCKVLVVDLLANQETDEVYTKMTLDPRISGESPPEEGEEGGRGGRGGVVSFAKVLTPSDANNGGGFSVPRFCADSIFPPLNYKVEPPVQTLTVRDVHDNVWEFRHIYRGTPRRHLLTTGWSKFVNSKRLVAGDAVVFAKKSSGELFVGVRRAGRCARPSELLRCSPQGASSSARLGENFGEGFSRSCRGRVTAESVMEAVTLAGMDRPFEVTYYPRVGFPDFVVRKEVVEPAIQMHWSAGTRVKMAVETEDASRMASFQGTVTAVLRHPPPFTCSPWRTLEVTWDEPDVLENIKRVNPWQLELVSVSPPIMNPYPAIKRPKITEHQASLTDGLEENMFSELSGFSNPMTGSISLSMFNHNIFPVGMQGARHDPICVSSISNVQHNSTHQTFFDKLHGIMVPIKTDHVSSELNIGGISAASQLENSSPPSQNSICYGTELSSNLAGNTPSKVIRGSFQLFGKTIQMEQEVVADVKEDFKDNNATDNVSDSYPQKQLHGSPDDQLHGVSAMET